MNMNEYLDRLSRLLADIPYEEHEEALSYYREYIEDAGAENEQRVIDELGTPEQLAAEIREGLLSSAEPGKRQGKPINAPESVSDSYRADYGSKGAEDARQDSARNDSNGAYSGKACNNSNPRQPKPEKSKANAILIILLLISTSPLWIPLAFSIIITVFACVFAAAAAGIICIVTGISLIAIGIPPLFALSAASAITGFALIGAGLIVASIGILFAILTVWLFGWAFPAFIRFIRQAISSISCRKKEARI